MAANVPLRIIGRMSVLRSRIDPGSPEARSDSEAMRRLVEELRRRQADLVAGGAGGDERPIARHV